MEDGVLNVEVEVVKVPKTDFGLNGNVIEAILVAEEALRTAIKAWVQVEVCEANLAFSDDEDTTGVERLIASRGVGSARVTVEVLSALLNKK